MITVKNVIRTALLLALFSAPLCAPAYAKDDAPRLRVRADKKTIFIGDRIRYEIEASSPEGLEILMPSFKNDKIGDFEIKDSGQEKKTGFFGKRSISNWYSITIYSPGKQVIPQAEVRYRKKGAKDWSILKTLAVNINVESVLAKTSPAPSDIRDIKGPFGFFEINWWFVGAFIIFISAPALFIIRRMRRVVPERLPHETALEELERARGDLLKGGGVKEFYVGVSDCIRRYIERAFALKAPEMTTEEFLNSLKDAGQLAAGQKGLLREFLSACDLVKFAKYAPSKTEVESLYDTAKKFVEETKG
ncbi:MAG: BatD family protein [Candidatus Omnitrophota bacterium]